MQELRPWTPANTLRLALLARLCFTMLARSRKKILGPPLDEILDPLLLSVNFRRTELCTNKDSLQSRQITIHKCLVWTAEIKVIFAHWPPSNLHNKTQVSSKLARILVKNYSSWYFSQGIRQVTLSRTTNDRVIRNKRKVSGH